jgi:chemotaxis response regulator CheB
VSRTVGITKKMTNVFIISKNLMFGDGLKSLLSQATRVKIVGQETNIERAIEQVKKIQPDVIILDSEDAVYALTLMLRRVLQPQSTIKVIGLNLNSNDLYTYQTSYRVARGAEDLVELIQNEPGLEATNSKVKQPREQKIM